MSSGNKMFRIRVNGIVVRVRFSEERSADVKCKIRDILTEAYQERFQGKMQAGIRDLSRDAE